MLTPHGWHVLSAVSVSSSHPRRHRSAESAIRLQVGLMELSPSRTPGRKLRDSNLLAQEARAPRATVRVANASVVGSSMKATE